MYSDYRSANTYIVPEIHQNTEMDERSWKWTDAHFCSLPSQTNIYGCSKIIGSGVTKKLLIASLVGKFYTIEYQRIFDKLTPSTKEVQFTYIPGKVISNFEQRKIYIYR